MQWVHLKKQWNDLEANCPEEISRWELTVKQILTKIPDDLAITLLSKEIVTPSMPAKNLGVTVDCNLTYEEHVTQENFEMFR